MSVDPMLFERAARAFNSIEVSKGQVVSIATCDQEGHPDVAPIGSMRVVDHETVHVLQGFLPRTMKNLEVNPEAAFSVTVRSSVIADVLNGVRGTSAPMGYRLYGHLESVDEDRAVVAAETRGNREARSLVPPQSVRWLLCEESAAIAEVPNPRGSRYRIDRNEALRDSLTPGRPRHRNRGIDAHGRCRAWPQSWHRRTWPLSSLAAIAASTHMAVVEPGRNRGIDAHGRCRAQPS
ncbi:MAG: pyridoxamine 5'-phosphate oxidase family protein [Polyangiaceae bacterium]